MARRSVHRYQIKATFMLALILAIITTSLLATSGRFELLVPHCSAESIGDETDEDDDFLAEILAEEARQEEEHARLEAEVREYEELRARQSSSSSLAGDKPKMGGDKMGGGNMNMGGGGGGGAKRSMPKGAAGANFSKLEAELKKKEAESASKKAAQEEEEAAKKAEKIRLKREAAFEAELKKMNEEQRKAAQKQKAIDARVVKRILKASKAGSHYAVLGIHNLEIQLGPFYIFNYSIGPFRLFRVKTKEIKRVYRNLARTVHPDKNKDGRAEEAFHALETSAAILTDEKKRADYDRKIISARRRRNKNAVNTIMGVSQMALSRTLSAMRITKQVLGPFSTPILVLGALMI